MKCIRAVKEPNSILIFKQKIKTKFKISYLFMSKKTKAFIYQLLSFIIFFLGFTYIFKQFFSFEDLYIKLMAFAVGTVFAPKFLAVQTKDGEKLFVKWLFIKGMKEIK